MSKHRGLRLVRCYRGGPTDRQVRIVLRRHGYAGAQYIRMCPPGKPGEESTIVLERENVSFHFSPSDPMYRPDGRGGVYPVTPFDLFATLEFNGDYKAAVAALKRGHHDKR